MQFETHSLEAHPNAPSESWFARLVAFVVWLLDSIGKLKRVRCTTKFKPTWRDHFAELVPLEWHRHQMLAQGAALLLGGKTLNDATYEQHPMPADFGGPCPRSPFELNRRFLVIADFLKNPEAHILRHAARIARREGRDLSSDPLRHAASQRAASPTCVASEGGKRGRLASPSRHATGWRWIAASSRRDGGGLAFAQARAPPTLSLFPTAHAPLPQRASA